MESLNYKFAEWHINARSQHKSYRLSPLQMAFAHVMATVAGWSHCSSSCDECIYEASLYGNPEWHSTLKLFNQFKAMSRLMKLRCYIPRHDGSVLQWRHIGRDDISNHQPHDCLLKRSFRRRSKKTSKLRVIDLCEGNSSVTGEFPAQRASYAENVSIWWRHHGPCETGVFLPSCCSHSATIYLGIHRIMTLLIWYIIYTEKYILMSEQRHVALIIYNHYIYAWIKQENSNVPAVHL